MYVIDSQVHVWMSDTSALPWRPEAMAPHHADPITIERLITAMDAVSVDAAILVSTRLYGFDNTYALESAAKYPGRAAVVGLVDPDVPDPQAVMRTWRDQPNMLGFRIVVTNEAEQGILERARPLFSAAERYGVPVCIYPRSGLNRLPQLIQRYPDLQFVIDHVGLPLPPLAIGEEPLRELQLVLNLAEFSNVALKLSCLPLLSKLDYPFEDLWPTLDAILEAFGLNRVMWGSDLTQVARDHSYAEALDYLRATDK